MNGREDKERKGEGSLDETGVWAAMSPKGERRAGEGGASMGMRAWESRANQMLRKRERTVHEDGECGTMPWSHENGVLVDPDIDGVHRAHDNSDRCA